MFSLFVNIMKNRDTNMLNSGKAITFTNSWQCGLGLNGGELIVDIRKGVSFSLISTSSANITKLTNLLFRPVLANDDDKSRSKSLFFISNLPLLIYCLSRKKFPSAFLGVRNASNL